MPKLIKNNAVVDDSYEILPKDFNEASVEGLKIVPLAYWLAHAENLKSQAEIGVWIDSDEGPEELAPFLDSLKLIALNFPKFADGRGYSIARILRDRYKYQGELRAIGDVLHDQLFYMKRCGFDAFAIRADKDPVAALAGLQAFSDCYQGASDNPVPLFRRRA